MALHYNELQFLVPWEIRELVTLSQQDKEVYIAEYTLLGRDFFTVLCMEAFSHDILTILPSPILIPSENDVLKSQQMEGHLMGFYNSPLIQIKYLIYNMLGHEFEIHRLIGNRQEILFRRMITNTSLDVTHDHTDIDTMKGSATQKHLVLQLMGPPAVRNTSPAVTALALMFNKQLHTQYSYTSLTYRLAALLQITQQDTPMWKFLMCAGQEPETIVRPAIPAVNTKIIRLLCMTGFQKARQIFNTVPGVARNQYILLFNQMLDRFKRVFAIWNGQRIGTVTLDRFARQHPNPIIQYVIRLVDGPVAVQDSSGIFDELMIARADNTNDDMVVRNATYVLENIDYISQGGNGDKLARLDTLYDRIALHKDRFAGLYNEYAQIFLTYHLHLTNSKAGKHHLRTADTKTCIQILFK